MKTSELVRMTSVIVSAYVSKNRILVSDLPDLIACTYGSLRGLAVGTAESQPSQARIKASVTHNRIISFIDGKPYKSLKWHLAVHGLTSDQYRARFGLPAAYPMTAPAYDKSARRPFANSAKNVQYKENPGRDGRRDK